MAGNAFYDLLANYAGDLASLPVYLDLERITLIKTDTIGHSLCKPLIDLNNHLFSSPPASDSGWGDF